MSFSIDVISLFFFIAGYIIGLGAVTVIDLHGFLARKSAYWTEATIRTHKITKPLIWLGIFLATVGGFFYYQSIGVPPVAFYHLAVLIILICNGLFLSFSVSPYLLEQEKKGKSSSLLPKKLQQKITASFIVSFVGWWSAVLLLVMHLVSRFS